MRVASLIDSPMLIEGVVRGMGIWDPPPSPPCRGPPDTIREGAGTVGFPLDDRCPLCYPFRIVGAVQPGVRASGRPVAVASARRVAESKFLSVSRKEPDS